MSTDDPFAQPSASRTVMDPESVAGGNAAYSYDGKPDRWKRYRLPDPDTGNPEGWTRATTFAKSISDTYTLSVWGGRMAIKGLSMRDDLYAAVAATPLDNKDELNRLFEECKETAGAKTGANLGTALHAFTEAVDRGEKIIIPPKWRPHVAAWEELLRRYNMEVIEIEKRVLHRRWGVAGTLDRVVRFRKATTVKLKQGRKFVEHTFPAGAIAILDLKTGRDLQYGWMEIAVQLSVYADAELIFDQDGGPGADWAWRPMYETMDRDVALVVHIPAQEAEAVATLYAVDLAFGRETGDLCEKVREARKRKNVAVALDVVEELATPAGADTIVVPSEIVRPRQQALKEELPLALPGRALEVRQPTLQERIDAAVTRAELEALWWEAVKAKKDDSLVSVRIEKRLKQILADTAAG